MDELDRLRATVEQTEPEPERIEKALEMFHALRSAARGELTDEERARLDEHRAFLADTFGIKRSP